MNATHLPTHAGGALSPPVDEMDLAERIAFGFLASYPPITRGSYRISLRQWFTWCHHHGIEVLAAERMHIEVWLRYLQEERGLKGSTAAGKLVALKGFYKTAVLDNHLAASPAAFVRRPKTDAESHSTWLGRTQLLESLDRGSGPLFVTKTGRRCTRNDAYWIVRNTAERAGLNHRGLIHPHSLRHSFATLSLDAGSSLRDVQQSGGWKTPSMPNYYDRRRESLARNSTHPLDGYIKGAA